MDPAWGAFDPPPILEVHLSVGPRERLLRRRPLLSVVVISYNMPRELPRTLFTLHPPYQRGIDPKDLEVILVDNGSRPPPEAERMPPGTRLVVMEDPTPSPAPAINRGLAEARGDLIGVMIDGARMASPGVVGLALRAAKLGSRPIIATLGFHLGPDVQMRSVTQGYCQQEEDRLLATVDWRSNGYELFKISVFAGSSESGWYAPMAESNALFLPASLWKELGGYDERFQSPGGGYVNLDTYVRACALPNTSLITLLGEGTFHQVHGGIATNNPLSNEERDVWRREYEDIRGRPFAAPTRGTFLFGSAPPQAEASFTHSARFLRG
jgi:glycosyltransferase involved in cell wall biosynthesis